MAHTPGPWRETPAYASIDIVGSDDERPDFASGVCRVDNDDDRQGAGVMRANARLIAAAPELLEALEEMRTLAGCAGWELRDGPFRAALEQAECAIRKARGKS